MGLYFRKEGARDLAQGRKERKKKGRQVLNI